MKLLKKKIIGFILFVISFFILYISLNIYQTKNIEIIPFEDIEKIELSKKESISEDTIILGRAHLEKFESVFTIDKIIVEDHLYLMIYKWPSFKKNTEISVPLKDINGLQQIKEISVVWGDIYSSEGTSRGISHNDLLNHPDQEAIWTKEEGS